MNPTKPNTGDSFDPVFDGPTQHEDWEYWEEDGTLGAPADDNDLLIDVDGAQTSKRPKSRFRQKVQNAQAGIKLDTDVSKFRRAAPQSTAHNVHNDTLKALEGSSTSGKSTKERTGAFNGTTRGRESDLSPEGRKIVIGIALPSDNISEHQSSPQTAGVETPIDMRNYIQRSAANKAPPQQQSVWSPDTEATESPYQSGRPASSIYSQPSMYGAPVASGHVPPVPALPSTFKFKQSQPSAFQDPDDDDVGTPCTLFEEDGSPMANRKSFRQKAAAVTGPQSEGTLPNGKWIYVTDVTTRETNPFKQQQTGESSSSAPKEWWQGMDEKKHQASKAQGLSVVTPPTLRQQNTDQSSMAQANASSSHNSQSDRPETHSEKARILLEESQVPADEPPPYSPPKTVNEVKYAAVFPPSHAANLRPIPSPGPVSPGLPGTMSSQGNMAINLAEIPLTPRRVPGAVLSDRPAGSHVIGDHFYGALGTRHRVERQRRRHEKEEAVARRVGGFWRGRGCMPENGCFGRSGREGRKRRRVYLGVFCGVVAAIVLAVVLAVTLTRTSAPPQGPEHSIWLNLTDFPPMPTGVLTVAGPDNSQSVSGCLTVTAQTSWSCKLPKDQQNPDSPYDADQPEFIFQIQYDNNTRALWNVSNTGEQPDVSNQTATVGNARLAVSRVIARAITIFRRGVIYDAGFSPKPAPPSLAEMNFLGNTTDGIVSDNKAGEPTPFYISLLSSNNATVGSDTVTRRGLGNGIDSAPDNGTSDWNLTDILPAPALNPDGTGAPAKLYPLPLQQPVRLFDRGLPTEHYGFYTFFDKTVYLHDKSKSVAADEDGGSPIKDAKFLITMSQTRFLVKIWTRKENTTQLLGNGTIPGTDGTTVDDQPGTMPYPVTIAEDLHGGNRNDKAQWYYGVDEKQQIDRTDVKLIVVDKGFAGTLINRLDSNSDLSLGGIDGGTGGCKCEWVNFQGRTVGTLE
ncbi:uncharacterized protein BCR38DRAFT_340551 [Pseudomassariella vexata]|uniref:Glycoprotease family protein n=1 Tax=Pseudomassariella vexata TaxID=1141098 RepID=A0A1Y2E3P9_9PEZI|nr:uncharacterized protein BCR38DRAFT_340551 [Pseudomassariella vexata]ORY65926.1 hypothetical protein BCR38DRAFT_340551 [Pseudomassariella vexata]